MHNKNEVLHCSKYAKCSVAIAGNYRKNFSFLLLLQFNNSKNSLFLKNSIIESFSTLTVSINNAHLLGNFVSVGRKLYEDLRHEFESYFMGIIGKSVHL